MIHVLPTDVKNLTFASGGDVDPIHEIVPIIGARAGAALFVPFEPRTLLGTRSVFCIRCLFFDR